MKLDEFAFVNRQLAGMLQSGIPLEGGLRQLCANLERGGLRAELELLEKDLSEGVPLNDALPKRSLPDFYKRMVGIGSAANDLPGMLLNLADYYSRRDALWSRLKGLLVYPLIVLTLASAVSLFVALAYGGFIKDLGETFADGFGSQIGLGIQASVLLWLPAIVLLIALAAGLFAAFAPAARERLRWRCPGFREASLAQVAGSLSMMLKGGSPLGEALALMSEVERGNCAGEQLNSWSRSVEQGSQGLTSVFTPGRAFPPLFVWLVSSAGEDAAMGLDRAKEVYHERALRRSDMLLFAALPVSIVALGFLLVAQAAPIVGQVTEFMDLYGF